VARGATQIGEAVSESETLGAAIDLLTSGPVSDRKLAEAVDLLFALQRQAKAGVHKNARTKNPVLTILGNPITKGTLAAGELLSRDVQAVLYIHDLDRVPYAHGFGDANLTLDTLGRGDSYTVEGHRKVAKGGEVVIGGLKDQTGIAMMGVKGGEIVLFDEARMPF
jgi:hypothetical protein